MRISIEKLVRKMLAMNADPAVKDTEKAQNLKAFLNENDYVVAYQKHSELSMKILELEIEKTKYEKIIKTVVEYKSLK